MKSSKPLNSKKQGEFDWVVFPENTNFVPNSATAMCLIISIHDDKKQTMGRYPKLKLYHYSSKRSEIVVTIPTRRQACCWILRKLQTTQNSGTQPVQNPLREIYRRTFAAVTEPSQRNQNAAYTFCTTIKYILTLSKSTLTHSQIFQSHSPTFLKSILLQWTKEEGKVVFPHYKTLFIRRSFVLSRLKVRSQKLFFQERKSLWENWLAEVKNT